MKLINRHEGERSQLIDLIFITIDGLEGEGKGLEKVNHRGGQRIIIN